MDNFKEFYDTSLIYELQELDKERLKVKNKILLFLFIVSLGPIALTIVKSVECIITGDYKLLINAGSYSIAALGLCYIVLFNVLKRACSLKYIRKFKETILNSICRFIEAKLSYSDDQNDFMIGMGKSGLLPSNFTQRNISDGFKGKVGLTKILFCELEMLKRLPGSKNHEILFQGFYFKADFNKSFSDRTVILPKSLKNITAKFLANPEGTEKIDLDDPEFNEKFLVYSSSQQEARYLLSPSTMKRIVQFSERLNSAFGLSFVNDMLHIAIPSSRDIFEPRIMKTIVDYSFIEEMYLDIMFFVDIVQELDLNTRIWTK